MEDKMFPPKIIGIIGNLGKMSTNIVAPLVEEAGYEVIGSDIRNPRGLKNREVVERADVVYFSILPISTVSQAMLELIPCARPNTLWLHGTSIQNPAKNPIGQVLLNQELIKRKVDAGFLHFMVGPMIRSLRGQSIMYGFPKPLINSDWEQWLINLLTPKKPNIFRYAPEQHDEITAESQLIAMIISLVRSQLWLKQKYSLQEIMRIAGPPYRLQTYGAIRNLSQPDIIANIIVNHPNAKKVLKEVIEILQSVAENIDGGEKIISKMAETGLQIIPDSELNEIKQSIDWHIRLEGDMQGGAVCFIFSPEENKLGLLTQVLKIFDEHGLDKTSCMSQEMPGGGCKFHIGVKINIDDPRVRAACDRVIKELGGKMATMP